MLPKPALIHREPHCLPREGGATPASPATVLRRPVERPKAQVSARAVVHCDGTSTCEIYDNARGTRPGVRGRQGWPPVVSMTPKWLAGAGPPRGCSPALGASLTLAR